MGRIKPKTVSKLMDVANRFADGEDACNNKRTRFPEDDRRNRYGSQRRRSRNYDNHSYHSQVAAGYKDNSYQGSERRSSGYQSYGKEDYKNFPTKESREYNPSPEDMLNEPCHIHSAFVDGKRVSRHAMKREGERCRGYTSTRRVLRGLLVFVPPDTRLPNSLVVYFCVFLVRVDNLY
jgi:hypothetical protein